MLKLSHIVIDAKRSVGTGLLLTDITPVYLYQNQKKTDQIIAHKYECAMPDKNLDKVDVKIDGKKLLDLTDEYIEVEFENLELSFYTREGQLQISAKATGIVPVKTK